MSNISTEILQDTQNQTPGPQSKKAADLKEGRSDAFASLLRGQVSEGVSITRLEQNLKVPQAASRDKPDVIIPTERDDRPVEEYEAVDDGHGDDLSDAADDTEAPAEGPVSTQNQQAQANIDADASAIAANTNGQETGPVQEQTATDAQAGIVNLNVQPIAQEQAQASTQAQAAAAVVKPDAVAGDARQTPQAAQQKGATLAGENTATKQVETQTASLQKAVETKGGNTNAANGANKNTINANVTEQSVSQPNNSLGRAAATTAQEARPSVPGDGRPTATDLANAAHDAEVLLGTTKPKGKATAPGQQVRNAANGLGENGQAQNRAGVNVNANEAASVNPAAQRATPTPAAGISTAGQPASFGSALSSSNSAGGQINGAAPLSGSGNTDPTLATSQPNAPHSPAGPSAKAAAQAAAHARPAQLPAVIADQVAVNINRAHAQGLDRINIQMRPSELGRVDVRMEVAHDGRMTAVISVERQETYDMLRNDQRSLLETLQNAGLDVEQNSLSFNLKGQGGSGAETAENANGKSNGKDGTEPGEETADAGLDDGAGDEMLGLGETAEADADGRYDVMV